MSYKDKEFELKRDLDVILIPAGQKYTIPAGTKGVITQALGGNYTIATAYGLSQIKETDLDVLGLEKPKAEAKPNPATVKANGAVSEEDVWNQLKQCYDPEIPVNIVDLGLVYDCQVTSLAEGGNRVDVKMTLTAPGCGMGGVIASDAEQKIREVPGVTDVHVEVVWDPIWNQSMMSDAARLQLGLM